MSECGILRRLPLRARPVNGPPNDAPAGLLDANEAPLNHVAMIEVTGNGTSWRLPFPCIRKADGWHNARTGKLLTGDFDVTGYRLGETWGRRDLRSHKFGGGYR